MNDNRQTSENNLALSAADADKLLACADGKSALLYLHILRCGAFSMTKAARDLRCTEGEIAQAADNLRRLGIMPGGQQLPPADEIPEYSGRDIATRAKTDSAFEGIIFEAQQALGKMLSTNDMRILFGIYDHLGLPAEVIAVLINHCIETYRAANGEGRMPTMRYVEKEAWYWVNAEIVTLDAAEEHIRREKQKQQLTEQAKAALQIHGRALTPTERKYVEGWLGMGFMPEALAIAYDRTVIGTGKLTWKYMDKILQDWHGKGLFTPEEIERGDARYRKKSASSAAADGGVSKEIENMRKLYESMKKGK